VHLPIGWFITLLIRPVTDRLFGGVASRKLQSQEGIDWRIVDRRLFLLLSLLAAIIFGYMGLFFVADAYVHFFSAADPHTALKSKLGGAIIGIWIVGFIVAAIIGDVALRMKRQLRYEHQYD
jgi:hypothetical protein